MPNTPALLGESMTGISWIADEFSKVEKEGLIALFDSFGKSVVVEERLMDAVVSVSGSSPAFAYMFIDALADAGVKYGLKKSEAIQMAAQTLLGSAKMVLESGEHPAVLKDKVCSPGERPLLVWPHWRSQDFEQVFLQGQRLYIKSVQR